MSNRRKRANAKNKTFAYIAAGVVHLVIIVLLVFNFANKPKVSEAAFAKKVAVVKAKTVDASVIKKHQDKLIQDERDKEREKQRELDRLKKLKQDALDEKKNLDELKKQNRLEKERAKKEEAERKAIALKKKTEEEARKKIEAEKKRKRDKIKREQLEKERKEKRKRDEETQRLLNASMAAEEAFQAKKMAKQRATNLSGKYTALIKEKVESKRRIPPNIEAWRTTRVSVKLSPSGDVLSVAIVKSSGSQQYDRSVETAVRQATPLPIPSVEEDPEVNKLFQTLTFNVDMSGI